LFRLLQFLKWNFLWNEKLFLLIYIYIYICKWKLYLCYILLQFNNISNTLNRCLNSRNFFSLIFIHIQMLIFFKFLLKNFYISIWEVHGWENDLGNIDFIGFVLESDIYVMSKHMCQRMIVWSVILMQSFILFAIILTALQSVVEIATSIRTEIDIYHRKADCFYVWENRRLCSVQPSPSAKSPHILDRWNTSFENLSAACIFISVTFLTRRVTNFTAIFVKKRIKTRNYAFIWQEDVVSTRI